MQHKQNVACKGVVVIPCPNETVSNLQLFQLKNIGLPTSSNCNSGDLSKFVSLINFLNFSSPTFLAIIKVPTLDDLIKISSTERFFGNSFISDILCLEHFIERVYF